MSKEFVLILLDDSPDKAEFLYGNDAELVDVRYDGDLNQAIIGRYEE